MTTVIERMLERYRPGDASEAADVQRLRELVARTDVWSRSTPVHVTGSALVVHPPSRTVLLRWHPRMQMWMQVGGHFDAGETDPRLVALREAQEETGLSDLRAVGEQPVQIVIVPVPANDREPAHEHADIRYLFVTDAPETIVAESTEAPLRWIDLTVARTETKEDNLRVFLSRVSEALQ